MRKKDFGELQHVSGLPDSLRDTCEVEGFELIGMGCLA